MDLLCHACITTGNLSYRFPIFETSATALCGTTGRKVKIIKIIVAAVEIVVAVEICSSGGSSGGSSSSSSRRRSNSRWRSSSSRS